MATTDIFPVDPDWPVVRTRRPNRAAFTAASGEVVQRTIGPLNRILDLSFGSRALADWTSIEDFRLAQHQEFFTFEDKSLSPSRDYSCHFAGEPTYAEAGNEEVDIRVRLIEAAGEALRNDPTTPLITLPLAEGVTVTGGEMFTYPGYGYKITGSGVTDVELDGVSVGATLEKFDVPVLFHQLLVKPNVAGVTKIEFVH